MDIQLTRLEKSEMKLTVELTQEEMAPYEKQAAAELQDKVTVEGFRKGHVPFEILKQHVGDQAFLGQVLDIAISDSYTKAVKEKGLHPIDYPRVNVLAHTPLKYEAVLPVVPEVSFKKEPSTITVKRKKPEVTEAEVKEVVKNLLERFKKWKEVSGAAKMDHKVEIDFDGFDEGGAPVEGTSSKNHPLVLGSKTLIPGFEEEIVGMKKGEEKDFNITFPADYHKKSFQGKKMKFHVKLNLVEEAEDRKADDSLARDVTGDKEKTFADLDKEIRTELLHQKEHDETARLENEFLKELLALTEAEIPESLIEKEIDFMVERLKKDLQRSGKTWEAYLEELKKEGKDEGKGEEHIRKELHKPANEQLLMRLGLEKLYETENPEVSEADIAAEIEHVLSHYPVYLRENAAKNYAEGTDGREYLKSGLRLKKIVEAHTK